MSIYSSDFPLLTHLQRHTLQLVSEGFSNLEISKQHEVSEKAVEQMVGRICQSLHLGVDPGHNLRVLLTLAYFTGSNHLEK
jgi:DNA-binding NarL/FixJ family response regulator